MPSPLPARSPPSIRRSTSASLDADRLLEVHTACTRRGERVLILAEDPVLLDDDPS